MANKKKAAKAAPAPKANKSAFVRQYMNLSPKEIVAKAKEAGIDISEKYVSTAKYNAKKSGAAGGAPKKRGRPAGVKSRAAAPAAKGSGSGSRGDIEKRLRILAALVGSNVLTNTDLGLLKAQLEGVLKTFLALGFFGAPTHEHRRRHRRLRAHARGLRAFCRLASSRVDIPP
jgi:hypothetical protein